MADHEPGAAEEVDGEDPMIQDGADVVCPECGHASVRHYAVRMAEPDGRAHCGIELGCEDCNLLGR
jgi:hypothetical protein